jgi:hypothetical protein
MESTVSQRTAEVWRQSFGYLEEKERPDRSKEIISKRIEGVGYVDWQRCAGSARLGAKPRNVGRRVAK